MTTGPYAPTVRWRREVVDLPTAMVCDRCGMGVAGPAVRYTWPLGGFPRHYHEACDRQRTPYPEFCRHPEQCVDKSSCPRDPTCAD